MIYYCCGISFNFFVFNCCNVNLDLVDVRKKYILKNCIKFNDLIIFN